MIWTSTEVSLQQADSRGIFAPVCRRCYQHEAFTLFYNKSLNLLNSTSWRMACGLCELKQASTPTATGTESDLICVSIMQSRQEIILKFNVFLLINNLFLLKPGSLQHGMVCILTHFNHQGITIGLKPNFETWTAYLQTVFFCLKACQK